MNPYRIASTILGTSPIWLFALLIGAIAVAENGWLVAFAMFGAVIGICAVVIFLIALHCWLSDEAHDWDQDHREPRRDPVKSTPK